MSSATMVMRADGCFWLLLVEACCYGIVYVVPIEYITVIKTVTCICVMLFVMYRSMVFSFLFANVERSELGLY